VNLAVGLMRCTSPPTGFTNIISCCSYSGRFRRKTRLFPEMFDASRLRGIKSLRDFDERVTAYYCGLLGRMITTIAQPDSCSGSDCASYAGDPRRNDPFIRILPETRQKLLSNRNIIYNESEDGGHCGSWRARKFFELRWAVAEREVWSSRNSSVGRARTLVTHARTKVPRCARDDILSICAGGASKPGQNFSAVSLQPRSQKGEEEHGEENYEQASRCGPDADAVFGKD